MLSLKMQHLATSPVFATPSVELVNFVFHELQYFYFYFEDVFMPPGYNKCIIHALLHLASTALKQNKNFTINVVIMKSSHKFNASFII